MDDLSSTPGFIVTGPFKGVCQFLEQIPGAVFTYRRAFFWWAGSIRAEFIFAGLSYNIAPDPLDRVDLRVQDYYAFGNDTRAFGTVTDTFRADGNTVAVSLRYLHSPFGVPGYQVSLTAGYKTYDKVRDGSTFGLALTGVKRLGSGFDLVMQYQYQNRQAAYAAAYSGVKDEHSVQVGFVFNFNNTFNKHLGPRRSLLNLQHQYVPD